jgi:hypothetical protein
MYFMKSEYPSPSIEELKTWPLCSKFKETLTHLTEKPKFMQPKAHKCEVSVDTFYVSPRMIIRRALFKNDSIPFADSFNFENKMTFE